MADTKDIGDMSVKDFLAWMRADQVQALRDAPGALPPKLQALAPINAEMLDIYEENVPPHKRPTKSRAATDFKNTKEVVKILEIKWNHWSTKHVLKMKRKNEEPRSLSPHYAAVVDDLHSNEYVSGRTDEGYSRTVLDLLLLDRLNHLRDSGAFEKLRISAEVPLSVKVKDSNDDDLLIKGCADWSLGYGEQTGSLLIAVEAKGPGKTDVGMPQLVIYLEAIQRARQGRPNKTVWGMLSHGSNFTFACLNEDKVLRTSNSLDWRTEQSSVLGYIDTILLDAIQSSPHTAPDKRENTVLRGYSRYLGRSWDFMDDEDADHDESLLAVRVVKKGNQVTMQEDNTSVFDS